MSLLIDALKKAEEAKRRAAATADGQSETSPAPRIEPLDLMAREREIARQLDPPVPPPRPAREPRPEAAANAESARKLFEVKTPRRRISFALGVGLLTTLASLAIALYFWLQLRPAGVQLVTPQARANPPLAPAPTASLAPTRPDTGNAVAITRPPPMVTVQRAEPDAAPARRPAPSSSAPSRGSFAEAEPLPAASAGPASLPAHIPVRRSSSPMTVPAPLAEAWQAYQSGALARAGDLYREVLSADPDNADALNGMGAIAMRGGRRDEALHWFALTLRAHPQDAVALAARSSLQPQLDSGADESRLRSLVAEQPEASALHFALGNRLAAERRWSEAQASYFKAHDLDRANPDYLFNLAVSLDHMGQAALAARFYTESLAAARTRSSSFQAEAVQARLAALATR